MSSYIAEANESGERKVQSPAHHPSAPQDELFNLSTTVDPSHVIHLIRKLLPSDVTDADATSGSGILGQEKKSEVKKEDTINLPENGGKTEAMESSDVHHKGDGKEGMDGIQNQGRSTREEIWEECGCTLWDLAASEDHAQFMVQNLVLEVLLANLMVSQSSRITEIGLGILGNLACHEISRKEIASANALVLVVVDQLFLDDVPCLCEACRVITLCLQGNEGVTWAGALQDERILSRVLWMAENALNPQLIERSVGLLLAVLESQEEVAVVLLPPLMKLDLSGLLINLLAFEMSKFKDELTAERYSVLEVVLRTIEALSVVDHYSQEISQNKELFQLLKDVIELPDKIEIANSSVTSAVLIANILTDSTELVSELSEDMNFLQGLFDVFPFASGDAEAQSAIWSIVGRLFALIKEREMSLLILHRLVSILTCKVEIIEDVLLDHISDDREHIPGSTSGTKRDAISIVIKRISDILTRWKSINDEMNTVSVEDNYINKEDVEKLLILCYKASRLTANIPESILETFSVGKNISLPAS